MTGRRGRDGFEVVREIAAAMEDVQESTTDRGPSFKVHGRLMACKAINKSAEPGSLMARVGFDQRDELIAGDPRVYYLSDHYADHPVVLVRLSRIDRDSLEGLLQMARRFVNTRKRGRRRAPEPRSAT
jgi:hypothetical protein